MGTPAKTSFDHIEVGPKIRGVLIDLDNTLYEYAPCHDKAMKAVHAEHHKKQGMTYEDFLNSYSSAQKKVKSRIPSHGASHSRLLYFQNMTEERDGKTNIKESLGADKTYWSNFYKEVSLRKDAVKFIEGCRKKGLKVCLVTDLTAQVQFHKMVEIGVDKLFDFIVTSEEAGADKPNLAIFTLALEKLRLNSNEVIMIGDDKTKDINGANKLGIKAYLV